MSDRELQQENERLRDSNNELSEQNELLKRENRQLLDAIARIRSDILKNVIKVVLDLNCATDTMTEKKEESTV